MRNQRLFDEVKESVSYGENRRLLDDAALTCVATPCVSGVTAAVSVTCCFLTSCCAPTTTELVAGAAIGAGGGAAFMCFCAAICCCRLTRNICQEVKQEERKRELSRRNEELLRSLLGDDVHQYVLRPLVEAPHRASMR